MFSLISDSSLTVSSIWPSLENIILTMHDRKINMNNKQQQKDKRIREQEHTAGGEGGYVFVYAVLYVFMFIECQKTEVNLKVRRVYEQAEF